MVAVVVADEDAINFRWFNAESIQSLLQLCTAEPLIDEHLRPFGFQQRRVAATAGAKVSDAHCHGVRMMRNAVGL